jgi:anti-sigma-K factor RskA
MFAIGLWRMNAQLIRQQQEIEWLRDPSVQFALLAGMDPQPQANARMIWNPSESRGMLYVNRLQPLPSEKDYQLWVIGNQGPVSAGIFSPNERGNAVITISPIYQSPTGSLQFAVTIEPKGGVPQPTGSMILAGRL